MEASALRYSGGIGVHGRSPLLRLQSDERLILMVRRGSTAAFEVLVSRYHARLLSFCRHLLGSREDAEDVLQEVLAAAFNAILADERPINVRPWLYRIARNRCLNHLRKTVAVGVDSMDVHLFDHGASTADEVHGREEFRLLVDDIRKLPETQRTALVLREMDALSYEQIAEAMETTVPSIKSLLVRARVSLAEAAEARMLSCEEVRVELAEVSEGLQKKSGPLVRRHLRTCKRCAVFNSQLKRTNKALTALLPIGPIALLRQLAISHIGHSAGASSGASGAGAAAPAAAIGSSAAAGSTAMLGSSGGIVSLSVGTIATKAAAGLAAAALGAVTVGAVAANHGVRAHRQAAPAAVGSGALSQAPGTIASVIAAPVAVIRSSGHGASAVKHAHKHRTHVTKKVALKVAVAPSGKHGQTDASGKRKPPAGRTQSQTVGTVLPTPPVAGIPPTTNAVPPTGTTPTTTTDPSTTTTPTSTTPATTTTPTSTTPSTVATPTSTTPSASTEPSTTTAPTLTPRQAAPVHQRRPERHRRHRRARER
ncbi:MAG: RNA polymerase sigma factor [Actinomycetota bacterium]|nr:RNA polymerase sigma factor [Actinomycetota bacterium]